MKCVIKNKEYNVEVIKKRNKNTYIRFKNNTIYVTTNILATKSYVKDLIEKNYIQIEKMIDKSLLKQEKANDFYLYGKRYDKIYVSDLDNLFINKDKIYIKEDKQLEKWLAKQIKEIFTARLNYIHSLFDENIPYPKLKIRSMKTRWGVCNKRNESITLNAHLIRYELECLDYVIIHELSHFIHFDHSNNFWKLVAKYCKDYKKIRNILKD